MYKKIVVNKEVIESNKVSSGFTLITLYDDQNEYGQVLITGRYKANFLQKCVDTYKSEDEEFNNEDCFDWLEEHGFELYEFESEHVYF